MLVIRINQSLINTSMHYRFFSFVWQLESNNEIIILKINKNEKLQFLHNDNEWRFWGKTEKKVKFLKMVK